MCFLLVLFKWGTDFVIAVYSISLQGFFCYSWPLYCFLIFSKFILSQLVCFAWTNTSLFRSFAAMALQALCWIKHKLPPTRLALYPSLSTAIHNATCIFNIFSLTAEQLDLWYAANFFKTYYTCILSGRKSLPVLRYGIVKVYKMSSIFI